MKSILTKSIFTYILLTTVVAHGSKIMPKLPTLIAFERAGFNKIKYKNFIKNTKNTYTRYYRIQKKKMKLLNNTQRFSNKKYVFGGFDCSKFTQAVFATQGIELPRTAGEQSKKGKYIQKTNLQPGDLIIFKNTYKSGVSHVGIYLGNDKFIHNSSSKKRVCVSSLKNTYYSKHYHSGRRILIDS